jgi:paraquat-inducible protein A
MSAPAISALQQGLQNCEHCGLLSRPAPGAAEGHCPRCGGHLIFRKPDSLQRTVAYLVAAAICYIPANFLPIMTTVAFGNRESDTIMQGVILLWSPTGWPLSCIILIASIMIPSAKIGAMFYLVFSVRKGSVQTPAKRVKLFKIVEAIGRWSMIDVFVVTFTVALIQLQPLMSVEPAPGIFFFAAVVVLTMMAVECFDPRLIWDPASSQEAQTTEAQNV